MANKLPVKFYYNTMPGMPQITNNYGDTTNVLDCVLVNGTTPVSVSSITYAAGVCTVTMPSAHNFIVDMVIEIAGAAQDEFNGEYRITDITTNTFKYVPAVNPAVGTATGTLTVRIPPLGYDIAFTATNRRVYRSKNLLATRPFIKVDNELKANWTGTYGIFTRIQAAKTMTDIDTYTDGKFPNNPTNPTQNDVSTGSGSTATLGWFFWFQSYTGGGNSMENGRGGAAVRDWTVVGDDRTFYFVHNPMSDNSTQSYGSAHYGVGEYSSLRSNDPYNFFIMANECVTNMNANTPLYLDSNLSSSQLNNDASAGLILCKNSTNYGEYTNFALYSIRYRGNPQISGGVAMPFPNISDYSIRFSVRHICDTANNAYRGTLRGQYCLPQATPFVHKTIVPNATIDGTSTNRKMLLLRATYAGSTTQSYLLAYDITGPW